MEPTLQPGCHVLVAALTTPPQPGDIVLLRGPDGLVVHRVVALEDAGGTQLLFHRGDAPGHVGITRPEAVAGRVEATVTPSAGPLPGWENLDAAVRVRFASSRLRCLRYARLRRLARHWRLAGKPLVGRLGALARRLWL